jgi:putative phosphoesterase
VNTMRIGIISDIHGNLIALESVLAELKHERVDQIVCLGDVAFGGPQPSETVDRLRELGCSCVMGNTDDFFVHAPNPDPNYENEMRFREMIGWMTAQLSTDGLNFVRSFQPQIEIALENGEILLCYHGLPDSPSSVIFPTTSDDELAGLFNNHRAAVMAGGHTHTQMLRRYRNTVLINPGSVGMPFVRGATRDMDYRPPWSEYAVLSSEKAKLGVELLRVPLDVEAVVARALASGLPFADKWAALWRASRAD